MEAFGPKVLVTVCEVSLLPVVSAETGSRAPDTSDGGNYEAVAQPIAGAFKWIWPQLNGERQRVTSCELLTGGVGLAGWEGTHTDKLLSDIQQNTHL